MKSIFISISMMLMAFMANAQQVVNVEFLDGDLDCDNQITTNDVTGLIDTYLTNEEPRKTVSVTVDNSELQEQLDSINEGVAYLKAVSVLYPDVVQNKVDIARLQQAIADIDLSPYVTTAFLAEELAGIQRETQLAQLKADLAYDLAKAAIDKFADVWKEITNTTSELQDKIKEQNDKIATLEEVVARLMDEIEELKNGSE